MARILGLEALHMADSDVLPYDYATYGKEIAAYIDTAKRKSAARGLDFGPAEAASARFTKAAEAVHGHQLNPGPKPAQLNTLLRDTEADFISPTGLPNRAWYKHTIYAPGEYTGYAAVVIPGVNEALDAKDPATASQQLDVLTQALNRAATTLEGAE
jgi:N-acetylated-alpha-linked acidic dipeptidase